MNRRTWMILLLAGVLALAGGVTVVLLQSERPAPRVGQPAPGSAAGTALLGVIKAPGDCPVCGMHVVPGNRRAAQAVLQDGSTRVFCANRCMLTWYLKWLKPSSVDNVPGQDAVRELQVADHYRGQPLDARQAIFVAGSDVVGPMGPGFIALANAEEAAQFVRDHGGLSVTFAQIDATLIDAVVAGQVR